MLYEIIVVITMIIIIIIVVAVVISSTPSPPTKSLGFRGFDSKKLLILRGGELPYPYNCIGRLPESLTQGLLAGKLVVGGLGVPSNA